MGLDGLLTLATILAVPSTFTIAAICTSGRRHNRVPNNVRPARREHQACTMRSRELAELVGITEQNISLLKSGKVTGVLKHWRRSATRCIASLESCLNIPKPSKVLLTLINREHLEQN
jgi:hypothetical protein